MSKRVLNAHHQALVDWILKVMQELRISQRTLADEAQVKQPWISQFLVGSRKKVRPELLVQLKTALYRLIEQRAETTDQKVFMLQGAETLFQKMIAPRACLTQPDILRVAADVLAMLAEKCPDPNEQLRVINQLRASIQAEI